MATLHVRNVPDPLYEWLRASAAANGRSIGAEVVVVLEHQALAGGESDSWPRIASVRRRQGATPFERFSPRARQVIVAAQDEAAGLGAPGIGTEHLLLALFRGTGPFALLPLEDAGLSYDEVRAVVEAESTPGESASGHGLPFTPESKKALELALRECIGAHDPAIEPWHLLLGLAGVEEGPGARFLLEAGQDVNSLRQALRAMAPFPQQGPVLQHGFRVIELRGDAGDWEQQLNAHAARGHELVEIVDRRAIFRVTVSA